MFQPSLEAKKKFIAWFIANHPLKRRESLWILNYLLNHELLLKQIHFVQHVEATPKGMWFSTKSEASESFYFYKEGTRFNNPEQAFHDIRLNWKEACYIELEFDNNYLAMLQYGVLEDNEYYKPENVEDDPAVLQELEALQVQVLKEELKRGIDAALAAGDRETFLRLTTQLHQLEL